MDWMSFLFGIVVTIIVLFLFFWFLPLRALTRETKKQKTTLEKYWSLNNEYQRRQAEAVENIANSLIAKG